MPDLELKSDDVAIVPEVVPTDVPIVSTDDNNLDMRLNKLWTADFSNKDDTKKNKDVLELIYDEYGVIEKLKNHTADQLDVLKEFLLNYESILEYIKTIDNNSDSFKQLKEYIASQKSEIIKLIETDDDDDEAIEELTTILEKTEHDYKEIVNSFYKNEKINKNSLDTNDVNKGIESFSIPKVDEAYQKLYEAISSNDVKEITLYRGRLIRTLKHYKKDIDNYYDEIKLLDEVNSILFSNANAQVPVDKIDTVLEKNSDSSYKTYVSNMLSNPNNFKNEFYKLYQEKNVRKKTLYKNALSEELKAHGELLNERYSKEFLDRKATVGVSFKMLPNAVALSVKKLANTINELREAKTNKRKIDCSLSVAKAMGNVIATPAIFLGKFVVNNWYVLYLLNNKYIDTQKDINVDEQETNVTIDEKNDAVENTNDNNTPVQVEGNQEAVDNTNIGVNTGSGPGANDLNKDPRYGAAMSAYNASKTKELEGLPESYRLMQNAPTTELQSEVNDDTTPDVNHDPQPEAEPDTEPEVEGIRIDDKNYSFLPGMGGRGPGVGTINPVFY